MPNNPDLVPTTVVDVNGRTTIVHKLRKLFSSSSSRDAASRIPAPTTVTMKSLFVSDLMGPLSTAAGVTDKASIEKLGQDLHDNLPVDAIAYLSLIMERKDGFATAVARHLASKEFAADGSDKIRDDRFEVTLNNNALFYPVLGVEDYSELHGLVRGAQNMNVEHIELRDLLRLSKREAEQFTAVMRATKALRDYYPADMEDIGHPVRSYLYGGMETWSLKERGLYALLMEHPDSADDIVDAVVKHQTTDRYKVWGLMMGIEGPMAEGAL